jgi:hypothetical protein
MDKPVSLSVKHWIIRNMSVRTLTQESIIETVINHQFDSAYIALDKCKSLEFSGFGRFYFNEKKAIKKLEKLKALIEYWTSLINNPLTTEEKRKSLEYKLKLGIRDFEYLNIKLNGQDTVE